MKTFLAILSLALSYSCFAQDLKQAIEKYYSDSHLNYDSEVIRENNIQSIESVLYHSLNDSLRETRRTNKLEFNRAGYIICERCNSLSESEPKIEFEYDTLNRLVKKSLLTPSPKNYRQLRPSEFTVWKYNEMGELCKVFRYMMIDHLPTKNGASYFPEKLMLFSCDSISYNNGDSSVTIYQNYIEHCSNDSIELYPNSFIHHQNIQLYFHPNGNVKERITLREGVELKKEQFDSYGRSIVKQSDSPKQRLFEVLNYTGSLPSELKWLDSQDIKISTDNDSLLVIKSKFEPKVIGLQQGKESNGHVLEIDLKRRRIYFKNVTVWGYTNHRGSFITQTRHHRFYTDELQLVQHETWTTDDGDNFYLGQIEGLNQSEKNFERYNQCTYEYFQNGLLKCFTNLNSEGKVISEMVNELIYFE